MQGSWISPIPTVQGLIEDELLVQHVEDMLYEGHRGMMTEGPLRGALTGVAWNVRRVLTKTPSRRHFESKRTSKTGSTSKIGSRNGFVRFGKFCIIRSLSPYGVLNSGHKLTVTYYEEITIEPILNPEFDARSRF